MRGRDPPHPVTRTERAGRVDAIGHNSDHDVTISHWIK